MKRRMHQSRELVIDAIRKHPDVTADRIASMTGLSVNAVRLQIANLVDDDKIHEVKQAQKPGRLRIPMKGYRSGRNPAHEAVHEGLAPARWDVLDHFFGRVAVPEAA